MGAAACRALRVGCRARQGERARRRPQGAEDASIAWTVSPCPQPLRSMLPPHAALAERLTQGADASRAPLLIPTAHAILSPHAQALAERNILKIQRSLEQGEVRALERDMSRQAKQVVVRAHWSAALEIVYMSGCLFDGGGERGESGEVRRGRERR